MIINKEPVYEVPRMSGNYQDFSDAELLNKTREGDCDAFAELSVRYLWLVRTKARLFEGSTAPEKEDLCQEGLLGLYIAANSYEEGCGASFKTYAGVCIYNQMVNAARSHGSRKNKPLNDSISLDSADASEMASTESPEALLEIRENFQAVRKRMDLSLSPLERKVLALYLGGYERSEISEKAGIPLKVFDNALHRVRSKLKNL